MQVNNENCLVTMSRMKDNSVDSIVTDPPYGLRFMGKKWDYDVPSVEIWKECLRVLKPGGHLLAFAGTRTQHRMACNIEDAGFEIRDMIAWVYGSGFPKSHNISKAIDKAVGVEREIIGVTKGKTGENLNKLSRQNHNDSDDAAGMGAYGIGAKQTTVNIPVTAPATEEAKQWEGWGTALKPALEPITVARKPLSEKTVAANVLKWGTGGINIDACRVEKDETDRHEYGRDKELPHNNNTNSLGKFKTNTPYKEHTQGRFPANFIHDGDQMVLDLFPDSKSTIDKKIHSGKGSSLFVKNNINKIQRNDSGSAARFFYCAKTSKKDRDEGLTSLESKSGSNLHNSSGRDIGGKLFCTICGKRQGACKCETPIFSKQNPNTRKNNHPTVKPTKLMRYLCRLVTPIDGLIYDPFMGSGSTGKAAKLENFKFIGSELDSDSCEIAKLRINYVTPCRTN